MGLFPNIILGRVGTDSYTSSTFVGAARGDADRLFVVQQDGTIRPLRAAPYHDVLALSSGTESSQDNGAFAVAFHLRFADAAVMDHAGITGLDPHPMVNQPSSMGEDANGGLYVVNHTPRLRALVTRAYRR